MLLILGQARTADVEDWRVFDVSGVTASSFDHTEPLVMWPAEYWPELVALVEFDAARCALNLPPITNDCWQ